MTKTYSTTYFLLFSEGSVGTSLASGRPKDQDQDQDADGDITLPNSVVYMVKA